MQNKGNEKFLNKKSVKALIMGVITGVTSIIILFLIIGFAVTKMNSYPEKIMNYAILVILAVGGFSAGYVTGRIYRSSGILYGAVTGIVMFIIVFIAGISSISMGLTLFTLYKLVVLVVPSALGGILGVNKRDKIQIK